MANHDWQRQQYTTSPSGDGERGFFCHLFDIEKMVWRQEEELRQREIQKDPPFLPHPFFLFSACPPHSIRNSSFLVEETEPAGGFGKGLDRVAPQGKKGSSFRTGARKKVRRGAEAKGDSDCQRPKTLSCKRPLSQSLSTGACLGYPFPAYRKPGA